LREQREIGRPETCRIDRTLANGHDDLPQRPGGHSLEQPRAQRVLVDRVRRVTACLVSPKRSGEKFRLSQ
jgi:hypothetical protein